MAGILFAAYGALAYGLFLASFLYAMAFVANLPLPKTIDSGLAGPAGTAIAVDLLLLGVFAVQHSVMARPAFKARWTRLVPPPIERATYVLFASLALDLLFWQWRPIAGLAWTVEQPVARGVLQAVSWCGWGLVLLSSFLFSHFELFGLRQVYLHLTRRTPEAPAFRTPSLYRMVRHPIYLGFLLAFWSAPDMSWGRLLFAAACTAYILIGIQLEERDLLGLFGDQYRRYRRAVPMLLPWPGRAARRKAEAALTDAPSPR